MPIYYTHPFCQTPLSLYKNQIWIGTKFAKFGGFLGINQFLNLSKICAACIQTWNFGYKWQLFLIAGISKNYSPCGTFLPMKDHYKHIELYAALTDDVLSVDYNGDLTLYPRREEGG